jgi:anthranilate phosphoribosyltransferase
MLTTYIKNLQNKNNLTEEEAFSCLENIFDGKCNIEQIKELLFLLAKKGESVSEITGFTKGMLKYAVQIHLNKDAFDNCGTGGTNKDRFNVSTSSAFILASGGVPVAKHGNRGSQKANGSFDFLESLGIKFIHSPEEIESIFAKTDLCFLFARSHHQAMKYVVEARKELKCRTIFNLIGPLCNPAKVKYQIIGTTSSPIGKKLAQALQKLGTKKSLVIVGGDGLDELSTVSESEIYEITHTKINDYFFNPKNIHINAEIHTISGQNAAENAKIFTDLMSKKIVNHPISELIALNAGAAFYCFGKTATIKEGFLLAQKLIADGSCWNKFQEYKNIANSI